MGTTWALFMWVTVVYAGLFVGPLVVGSELVHDTCIGFLEPIPLPQLAFAFPPPSCQLHSQSSAQCSMGGFLHLLPPVTGRKLSVDN